MQFTVWSRLHLTSYIGWHKGGPCSIIQFHRTLIMKATIEFLLLLLLLGEVGAIVAPTYTFKFPIIAFLPFYFYLFMYFYFYLLFIYVFLFYFYFYLKLLM